MDGTILNPYQLEMESYLTRASISPHPHQYLLSFVIVFVDFIKSDNIKYLGLQGRNVCGTMCGIQQAQKRRVLIEAMKKFHKPKNTKETSSG